ncbi:TolB-like protein/Tfp pilus assembly protein PilF [Granulicella aggregans]|uniref:TolB-like protein/Tfp pilus assembly protein PilF n=1 Tax=Granulicella aggregans TaxID=474949 RepID=A0A7W7ZDR6_9BACT|nr:hypothetical protein [Granulicella aggregans]MBB5058044.1 TolB-like protein/Tfp pilus assembly protein PilF [Granulicella aggregans]
MNTELAQIDPLLANEQVERIVRSKVFSAASRSQAFLRYVIENSLANSAPKEFAIAVDVFERGTDYDSAVDATVRVEAGRLRTRLREYYAEEGQDDRLYIEIPKGSYAATFTVRDVAKDSGVPLNLVATDPREIGAAIGSEATATADQVPIAGSASRHLALRGSILACLLTLVLAASGWLLYEHGRAVEPIRSLAVLPLENLSGDPNQEYFVDGMTDQLITELAKIHDLRVVSRTSVMQDKASHKPLRQIAQELHVDAIIEGSVVRANDRVRITAQLIDTRDDTHLWAQSFEGRLSDVLSLQDDVARQVASQTKTALAPPGQDQLTGPKLVDPKAYDAYLRGRYFVDRREGKRAAAYFRDAIANDPKYAAAHAGLAEALITMNEVDGVPVGEVMPDAIVAAKRAIELNPNYGEGYTALGTIDTIFLWDWTAADSNLRRGIELSPGNSLAEIRYAIYLTSRVRTEDAIAHMRRAVDLDPLSFFANRHLGATLYLGRHYDEALSALARAAEIAPDQLGLVQGWVANLYEAEGKYDQSTYAGLRQVEALMSAKQAEPLRSAYEKEGWSGFHEAHLHLLLSQVGQPCNSYHVAEDYRALGKLNEAFHWYGRALDERCYYMAIFNADPRHDVIRRDPRFRELLLRMRLVP